tara:strand:- start:182 stop:808 length:627 start_codon:yes stop_codon:yes gene_type:complete
MPDYSQGKIYKVTCETGKIYIGSTVMSIQRRFYQHKCKHNLCLTRHFINPKIELIESYPCETVEDLLWKEREWIEKTECVNTYRPIVGKAEAKEHKKRSEKLRYQENKEKANAYGALYRQENKEMIKKKKADWYQQNKERIKERNALYQQQNKERIKESNALYYQKIQKKRSEKLNCECGGKYTHHHMSEHFKTKKHQAFVSSVKINL